MSQTFEFYDERARAAEDAADLAQLDNVRERELRSARAWRGMADRQLQIDARHSDNQPSTHPCGVHKSHGDIIE